MANLWWVFLLRAAVAFALGIGVLVSANARPALANFIAVYWLIGSALTIRWVLQNRHAPGARLATVAAVVGVAACVLVLARGVARDIIPADVVFNLLGVFIILAGMLRLSGALRDDQVAHEKPRFPHRVALGTLEVALGVVLLLARQTETVFVVAGVWGIVGGTLLLLDGLALRRAVREAASPSP